MPVDYTPASTFHETVQEIEDGHLPSAAHFNAPVEALADNTIWLRDNKVSSTDVATIAGPVTINGSLGFGPTGGYEPRVLSVTNADVIVNANTECVLYTCTNGATHTITLANTGTPSPFQELTVQFTRTPGQSGLLNIVCGDNGEAIASFVLGSTFDWRDNQGCIVLHYIGSGDTAWRIKSRDNFSADNWTP